MGSDRPSLQRILRGAGCSDRVIAHCDAVADCAMAFTGSSAVDRDLIVTGAMLHDIGRGITHTIAHGQAGGDICRRKRFPEEICRIVERHIGAGLTADECSLLGLTPRRCVPETIEEMIVAHADNLVQGIHPVSIERRMLESTLPRRTRHRMYRLARRVELFRR